MTQTLKRKIIDSILAAEGGFVDDPSDNGGPTRYGITLAVAREFQYEDDMKDLPRSFAFEIYSSHYWGLMRADDLLLISARITEEVVDTGINIGPNRASKIFQRVINVLNNNERLYSDLKVDGRIGAKTISAFEVCYHAKGEGVIMLAFNCLQGCHYISLAETHPKNERFVYGWLMKRVLL